MYPNGTERGCSWSFVPFLGKKPCLGPSVHPESWASPAKSVRMTTFRTCHDTSACWCARSVHFHLQQCRQSISTNIWQMLFHSVRSSALWRGLRHAFTIVPVQTENPLRFRVHIIPGYKVPLRNVVDLKSRGCRKL